MKRVIAFIVIYTMFLYSEGVCRDITNSDQIYLCSESKRNSADKYLNEQYLALLSKINAEYMNDNALKNEFTSNIKVSQRNWLKFRDSNCKLYSFQVDSKSPAYQTTFNECVARMSESRGKELAEFSNGM